MSYSTPAKLVKKARFSGGLADASEPAGLSTAIASPPNQSPNLPSDNKKSIAGLETKLSKLRRELSVVREDGYETRWLRPGAYISEAFKQLENRCEHFKFRIDLLRGYNTRMESTCSSEFQEMKKTIIKLQKRMARLESSTQSPSPDSISDSDSD